MLIPWRLSYFKLFFDGRNLVRTRFRLQQASQALSKPLRTSAYQFSFVPSEDERQNIKMFMQIIVNVES